MKTLGILSWLSIKCLGSLFSDILKYLQMVAMCFEILNVGTLNRCQAWPGLTRAWCAHCTLAWCACARSHAVSHRLSWSREHLLVFLHGIFSDCPVYLAKLATRILAGHTLYGLCFPWYPWYQPGNPLEGWSPHKNRWFLNKPLPMWFFGAHKPFMTRKIVGRLSC